MNPLVTQGSALPYATRESLAADSPRTRGSDGGWRLGQPRLKRGIARHAGSTVWRSGIRVAASVSKTVRLLVEAISSASAGNASLGPVPLRVSPPTRTPPESPAVPCWMAWWSVSLASARNGSGGLIGADGVEISERVARHATEDRSAGRCRDQDGGGVIAVAREHGRDGLDI